MIYCSWPTGQEVQLTVIRTGLRPLSDANYMQFSWVLTKMKRFECNSVAFNKNLDVDTARSVTQKSALHQRYLINVNWNQVVLLYIPTSRRIPSEYHTNLINVSRITVQMTRTPFFIMTNPAAISCIQLLKVSNLPCHQTMFVGLLVSCFQLNEDCAKWQLIVTWLAFMLDLLRPYVVLHWSNFQSQR